LGKGAFFIGELQVKELENGGFSTFFYINGYNSGLRCFATFALNDNGTPADGTQRMDPNGRTQTYGPPSEWIFNGYK
jgi:hypothetical protein